MDYDNRVIQNGTVSVGCWFAFTTGIDRMMTPVNWLTASEL